jgi:NTE family protein
VLGGGGITGAAYEMAALMSLRLATTWDPNEAEVVVGTSGGAFVTALVRNEALSLDSLVHPHDERADVADRIRRHVYTRNEGIKVRHWVRHGIVPGLRDPGLTLFFGSPAPYHAGGLTEWVSSHIGDEAGNRWPSKPTAVVAFDLATRRREVFGSESAPDVGIADAVAASSAIPLLFCPYPVGDRLYVDGGVVSGTHADVVLGADRPLDLLLVLAPMAADVSRKRARFYEKMFDRVGQRSLGEELALIREAWPDCEIVVLSPPPSVQNVMRPNPMDAGRAVATFMRTLISMKRTLAQPEVWELLEHHLTTRRRSRRVALH